MTALPTHRLEEAVRVRGTRVSVRAGSAVAGSLVTASVLLVLTLVARGRLEPTADPADAPWLGVWAAYAVCGAVVLDRRPRSPVGPVLVAVGLLPTTALLVEWSGVPRGVAWGTSAYDLLLVLLVVVLPTVFPEGVPRHGWAVGALVLGVLAFAACVVANLSATGWSEGVHDGAIQVVMVTGLALLGRQCVRAFRASQPERAQHQLFFAGLGCAVVVLVVGQLVSALVGEGAAAGAFVQYVGLVCVPISIVLAMVGAGLWETDVAVGRRLGLEGATVAVGLVLGTVTIAVASAWGGSASRAAAISLVLAVLAGLVLLRVRRLLAARLYGHRRAPDTNGALSEEALAALVADALRSPSAWLATPGGAQPGALAVPVDDERELVIAPRRIGESFTRADREVAEVMAQRLGEELRRRDLAADLDRARRALAEVRSDEERRLRAELHDNLGPLLVGAEMHALALADLGAEDAEDLAAVRRTADQLADHLGEARSALREVFDRAQPRSLAAGLPAALTQLVAGWREPDVHLQCAGAELLPGAIALTAYRIVSESLANVTRHAAAARCDVTVRVEAGALRIEVVDDGQGIDPSRPKGVGLHSMHGRVLEHGGSLVVDSAPGGGTRVVATIPLDGEYANPAR